MTTSTTRPLDGIYVLDLTANVAGPMGGQVLADLGARVDKVEPIEGEAARRITTPVPGNEGLQPYFIPYNRGKGSVALNLRDESDRETLLGMVEDADVFLQGNRPGALERLGLGPEDIHRRNPRCIYASLSAYGGEGDLGSRPGVDMIVQADSGCATGVIGPDGAPVTAGFQLVDTATGHVLAQAVLGALLHRERFGVVNTVNVSMYDVACSLQSNHLTLRINEPQKEMTWEERNERPASTVAVAPSGVFRALDGYIAIVAYVPAHWERFVQIIDRHELAEDDRFKDQNARAANSFTLSQILGEALCSRTVEYWVTEMQDSGLMVAPVNTHRDVVWTEMFEHSQMSLMTRVNGQLVPTLRTPARYSEFDLPDEQGNPALDQGPIDVA